MKQFAFLFALLFAMTVSAQESPAPQDSYVDQPQYVEYPSANQPQYAPAPQYGQPQYAPAQNQQYPAQYAQPQYAQPQYAPAQYPVAQPQYAPAQYPPQYYQQIFYDDSVAYYQNLIERYSRSGNSMRRGGNAMMIGGGITFGVGILMMVTAAADASNDCYYNDYSCQEDRDDAENVAVAGYLIAIGGGAVFTTGLVLKIVGGSKLRKAERFRNSLVQYNYRRQHALQLQIEPLINARKGSYGSRLSLNF
ncbi:MAG: hypothetical protein SPL21_11855 [Fibrobacter sp.]|nr:hypothetical protein [Fibrobacter sp.]MDY6388159.1 hypothetical protein [Fibrobacter sp.]